LRPGAIWLFADFVLPNRGIARLRARVWIGLLYSFFGVATGLRVSALPPSEDILVRYGWRRSEIREFEWGMIRSAVFTKGASTQAGVPSTAGLDCDAPPFVAPPAVE
jgi:hypothetical protein